MGSLKVREFISQIVFYHEIPDFLQVELLQRISKRGRGYCPEIKEALTTLKKSEL